MIGVCEKVLHFKDKPTCVQWTLVCDKGENLWQELATCVVVEKEKKIVQFALIVYLLFQGDPWLSMSKCNLCLLSLMPNQLAKH
jgi:hypothetical protein